MSVDPELYRRRLEDDPADEEAFAGLESIYFDGGYQAELGDLYEYRATYGVEGAAAAELFLRAAGIWLDQIGDIDRGMTALSQVLERDPTERAAVERLDALYRDRGDMAALMQMLETQIEALEAYDSGAATSALRAHYYQQLGEIWAQTYDRQDQAVLYFRRAFELDSSNVMALYCAREIYQQLGNYETAAKLLDLEARAETDGERRVALYRELAHTRAERLGDLEGAVVALKRALAYDPSNADVMGELALQLLRRAPMGGGDADRTRAADLLYQVATTTSGEGALGYCEAALDAWAEHEGALALFEDICRDSGRLDLLADRYRRLIEPLADSPLLPDIYRRAGNLALEAGNLDEAIGYYEGLLPLNEPSDREVLTDLYRRAGRGDDLANALSADLGAGDAGSSPAPDPEALPRLRELAELLRSQGREDEAEARMLEILELEPGAPEATSYLERRYRARGDWAALHQLLANVGGSQKLSAAARVVRLREAAGIAEERLGDVDAAVKAYKLAIILDPDDDDLPRQLERLLVDGERWGDLIDRIEATAARAETSDEKIEQLRKIADIYWTRLEDADTAAETHRRILELRSDDQSALEALDELFLRESRWDELISVIGRRERLAPLGKDKAALALRLAAIHHEHLEQPEEAYEACQQVLHHAPDNEEALRRMEAIDTIAGNWTRLVETLRYRADVAEGDRAVEFVVRAAQTAEKHLEDFEQALGLWQQVTELTPYNVEALAAKARCLEGLGRWDEALEGLEDVVEATEDAEVRLEVRRRIARVLEERGSRDEAIEAWTQLVDEAEDPEGLTALATHYEALGEHAELVAVLRRLAAATEDEEKLAEVMLTEARVQSGPLEDNSAAVSILEKILADVDPRSREALRQLRRIHVEQGDYDQAVDAAEREVKLTEDSAAKTELLLTCAAWYRMELEDPGRAIDANERVLEIDPYRTDVIASLEELYVEVEDWERLLQLTRARYKAATDDDQRRGLLLAGAEICEQQLDDGERAWGWYRELFDCFGHLPEVFTLVEESATRHGLARELVGVYGEMTKRAQSDTQQAGWWKKLGALYADPIGDTARAFEAILRGFALDPDDRELLDVIDTLAVEAGAHDRLARVYDALIDRESSPKGQVDLRRRAARVFLGEGGDAGYAFAQLFEALEVLPGDDELLIDLESAAEAAGRFEELLRVYESRQAVARGDGERIDLLLRSAQVIQEHLSDPDRAFGLVLEAVNIDPDDEHVATRAMQVVDGLERMAGMRTRSRYWGQLIAHYQKLIDQHDEEPEAQVIFFEWIARIQQDFIQDGRAALETRKMQTLILPGHKPSLIALERLAQRLGLWSDLVAHYKDALEVVLDRDAAIDLHRRRARVLTEELDRGNEAIEHYWQLIQIDPEDSETRQKLVRIYKHTERWNDLVLLLERELPRADEARQREIYLQVAAIWESKLNNSYEAIDAYRRVLSRWPDDETAQAAVERLRTPSRQSKDLGDDELAALGLLDDTEPPVFDDEPDDDKFVDDGEAEVLGSLDLQLVEGSSETVAFDDTTDPIAPAHSPIPTPPPSGVSDLLSASSAFEPVVDDEVMVDDDLIEEVVDDGEVIEEIDDDIVEEIDDLELEPLTDREQSPPPPPPPPAHPTKPPPLPPKK